MAKSSGGGGRAGRGGSFGPTQQNIDRAVSKLRGGKPVTVIFNDGATASLAPTDFFEGSGFRAKSFQSVTITLNKNTRPSIVKTKNIDRFLSQSDIRIIR